jgi:HK97 family phage major capsid protein/HK97 family phage prohead protease
VERAYAVLSLKKADGDKRTITGIASTPTPDRHGDIFEPLGATFANPLPLLLHHDTERPVGLATLTATRDGIQFNATIPEIPSAGALRERVKEVCDLLDAGLLRAVSIGYRILQNGVDYLESGGRHLRRTEICELSLVTVPANAATTIQSIKSFDLAASGRTLPGASGQPVRVPPMAKQTTAEAITQWENKRAALTARMTELMTKANEAGTTLDAEQATEHDDLELQVKDIDAHLTRLRAEEKRNASAAQPVAGTPAGTPSRVPYLSIKSNVPPGTAFVRAACAILVCNGNRREAADYAKRWDDSTPEVGLYLKAAVAPGTTTDATWASPLVNQGISNDFLELLRPATILGKIPNLRTVPFNTKVPMQTAGGTYGWVGESKPKPVTKLAFSSDSLGIAKAAGIIVLTEELVRLSNPSAEALCRRDMIAGIAQFLDTQFIDPAVAAVAGVNPASITNGAPTAAATTNPLADIMSLINHFATNNIPVDGVAFIMSASNALSLSFRSNLDGSPQFPGLTINGGTYKGLTFVTSQAAGTNVIALQPDLILYADDGGVSIDASREASLQMDSAPMSPADATTVFVSLWQTNNVGLRAERFINWKRVNANAVKYLTATAWPSPSGTTFEGGTPLARNGKTA